MRVGRFAISRGALEILGQTMGRTDVARLRESIGFVDARIGRQLAAVPAGGGGDFDPVLASLVDSEADVILSGLDTVGAWSAVIDAEPALGVVIGRADRRGGRRRREMRRSRTPVAGAPAG